MTPGQVLDRTEDHITQQLRIDISFDLRGPDRVLDDPDQNRCVAPVELLNGGTFVVAGRAHFGNEKTAQVRVGNEHLDMSFDQGLEARRKTVVLEDLKLEIDEDALVELLQNAVQQLALVAEVPIDQSI